MYVFFCAFTAYFIHYPVYLFIALVYVAYYSLLTHCPLFARVNLSTVMLQCFCCLMSLKILIWLLTRSPLCDFSHCMTHFKLLYFLAQGTVNILIFICVVWTCFPLRNGRLYVAAFSAILGSFVYGYSMALPSAVIPQVQEDNDPSMHMNVDQISLFGVRAAFRFLLNCIENSSIN